MDKTVTSSGDRTCEYKIRQDFFLIIILVNTTYSILILRIKVILGPYLNICLLLTSSIQAFLKTLRKNRTKLALNVLFTLENIIQLSLPHNMIDIAEKFTIFSFVLSTFSCFLICLFLFLEVNMYDYNASSDVFFILFCYQL